MPIRGQSFVGIDQTTRIFRAVVADGRPLVAEAQALVERLKKQFSFTDEHTRNQFFEWFERWFLRRAAPASQEQAA